MSIENGSCTILKLQREGERGGEETVGERKKAFSGIEEKMCMFS